MNDAHESFSIHPARRSPAWTSPLRHHNCAYRVPKSAIESRAGAFCGFGPQARAALQIAIEDGVLTEAGQYIVTYVFSDGEVSAALFEVEEVTSPRLRVKARTA